MNAAGSTMSTTHSEIRAGNCSCHQPASVMLVLPRPGRPGRRKKKQERSEPVRPCGAEAHPILERATILILPAEREEHIKKQSKRRKNGRKLPVSSARGWFASQTAHPRGEGCRRGRQLSSNSGACAKKVAWRISDVPIVSDHDSQISCTLRSFASPVRQRSACFCCTQAHRSKGRGCGNV